MAEKPEPVPIPSEPLTESGPRDFAAADESALVALEDFKAMLRVELPG